MPADPRGPDRVADALARLDQRLDQVIAEGRAAANEYARQPRFAPPPSRPAATPAFATMPPQPPAPARGPASWAEQISARQRALDGGPAQPARTPRFAIPTQTVPVAAVPAYAATPDFSGLEQQLRDINTQISTLHQPYEQGFSALRIDLADIGRALTEAMPRRAIETLESEVRTLSDRVDHSRQAGADGASLTAVEQELAEVRKALRGLKPAESLVGFEDAVRGLSQKIDHLAQGSGGSSDPLAFKQLEQAVVSLRGVVSNVASDGALSQLAAEVHGLASQFERAAAESSSEALTRLESRIASLMESGRAVPPELEGSIRQLSERLERMQLSQGDQLALGALEDRIAKLSEKLDASDAKLGQLDAVERGLADLLVHLEEMKNGGRTMRAAPAQEPATAPAPTPSPRPAPVAAPASAQTQAHAQSSPLDLIPELPPDGAPEMMATPEDVLELMPAHESAPVALAPRPAPMPAPQPARGKSMPRGPALQPIDPNLPPDTPLEPGSGAPRSRPGSAAARIAASEAALSGFRAAAADHGNKSSAIAAARNAAKSAYLDTPVQVSKPRNGKKEGGFKWPFSKKTKASVEPQFPAAPVHPSMPPLMPAPMHASISSSMPPPMPAAMPAGDDAADRPRGWRIGLLIKKLLIAGSVAAIIVGAALTAMDLLSPDVPPIPSVDLPDTLQVPKTAPKNAPNGAPNTTPSRPMPSPQGSLTLPPRADLEATGQIAGMPSPFDPTTMMSPKSPNGEVTGSIARKTPAPPRAPGANGSTGNAGVDPLPLSISPAMRHALAASDPGAAYELGIRYAEGRGLTQSTPEAARWLQHAADAGFAPAQFRLAGLNEKGEGIKKDVQTARRLYLAAAGKGHAKAMHNLAVLYAEGVEGKPDYKAASEWFLKAASYGVTDSQYNLAILYARGIGVQANLAESYRWFALAAAGGDTEAAKKRDEVATRLDKQTLAAAKAAAQNFAAEREPDEAINLKAPPGGWDKAPAAQAKPKRPAT